VKIIHLLVEKQDLAHPARNLNLNNLNLQHLVIEQALSVKITRLLMEKQGLAQPAQELAQLKRLWKALLVSRILKAWVITWNLFPETQTKHSTHSWNRNRSLNLSNLNLQHPLLAEQALSVKTTHLLMEKPGLAQPAQELAQLKRLWKALLASRILRAWVVMWNLFPETLTMHSTHSWNRS